jgi:hypothetical protein
LVTAAVLFSSVVLTATPAIGNAQIGSLRRKAEEAKKKLEEAAKKPDSAKAKTDTAKTKADTAKPAPTSSNTTTATQPASAKVWENYDFVPGNKVLFYTDFSEDRVGNFARGLKYMNGPMEIVERDDVKMLRATATGRITRSAGTSVAATLHAGDRHPYRGECIARRPPSGGGRQVTRSR